MPTLVALWVLAPAPVLAANDHLSLDSAVSAGLSASPALHQAELDAKRADVVLASARSEHLTYSADVNLADGYGANNLFSTTTVTAGQIPTANAQIVARVPLFTGQRIERGIDEALAGVDAGQAQLDQARQAAIWDVTEAYWLARRAELHEAIATEAVAKATLARDIVKRSQTIGATGEGDRDRAEVALLNQQGELLRAGDDRQLARDRLATLIQRDLAGVQLDDPPAADRPAPTLATAEATARAHRPDVRIATARVRAAAAEHDIAAADRWPQVAAEGVYQHGNNPYDPTAQSRVVLDRLAGNAYARINLTYHLLDQGVIERNIGTKSLLAGQATLALEAAQRAANLELRQALARVEGARRRITLGTRSVALARHNLTYMENRFRFGYALLTELNEARQNLVVADNQRVDASIDLALAQAALARATGTLAPPGAHGPIQTR